MKIIYLIALLSLVNLGYSQKNTSLSNEEYERLKALTKSTIYVNIDSCFYYVNKIEASNNPLHKGFATGTKGYLYQLKNDSIKSKEAIKRAYTYLNTVRKPLEKLELNAYLLNCDGLSNSDRYNLESALEKFQKGKKISEKIGDLVQVFKFNSNIASINIDIGNYNTAISTLKESAKFLIDNKTTFSQEEYNFLITNTFVNISNCYKSKYEQLKKEEKFMDSAIVYSQKAILNTKENSVLKLKILINLGNIYFHKNDFEKSNNVYLEAVKISSENNINTNNFLLSYNLGFLHFEFKKYAKALFYFKQVDSIWHSSKIKKITNDYLFSNYYQAKIYKKLGDDKNSLKHSKIYLDNADEFENFESKILEETLGVNNNLKNEELKNEVLTLNKNYEKKLIYKKFGLISAIAFIIVLLLLIVKKRKEKKKKSEKALNLIQIHKENLNNKDFFNLQAKNNINTENKKISIDDEKENEILEKLEKLERKMTYLNNDFTQEFVAKKIKTNTTYLSYVVNKRYEKSFSEYTNDLKINYAINELLTNQEYKNYTTQKIAESVGFKNAVSFRKSFVKKTGLSPSEFLKKYNNQNL